MKKITKPCKVDEKNYMFTEGINYFDTSKSSIWGKDDKDIIKVIKKEVVHENWLHLCAGDGRYNLELLKKVDSLTVTDIDESALSKLWHNTPKEYQKNLKIKVFNIINNFPFKDNSFDGIFCVAVLHLFPKEILKKIFSKIDRVLKPSGKIIMDFVVDAKRTKLGDGKPYIIKKRAEYTSNEAKTFFKDVLKKYKIEMCSSEVREKEYPKANPPYKLSCKFLLIIAKK